MIIIPLANEEVLIQESLLKPSKNSESLWHLHVNNLLSPPSQLRVMKIPFLTAQWRTHGSHPPNSHHEAEAPPWVRHTENPEI